VDAAHGLEIEMAYLGEEGGLEVRTRLEAAHQAQLGSWLFESRRFLNFSLGSLYLGLSLLDQLRRAHFLVTEDRLPLLGGTLLMLSSKFNEIESPTVQEVNSLFGRGRAFTLA
jgi:hypothetical protein